VHFLGIEVDLCNLPQVYDAAGRIRGERGGIGSPDMLTSDGLPRDDGKGLGLKGISIPRLDAVIMNAGIGGWSSLNWPLAVWTVLTGMPQSVTWPSYKIAKVGAKICGLDGKRRADDDGMLGEVFCANLFGHYILGHELMPLLRQTDGRPEGGRGRIIWVSSVEADADCFDEADFEGLKSLVPYESSKRLTDILALTADLPSVRRASETYFAIEDTPNQDGESEGTESKLQKPAVYLTHPGVCATDIVPLNFILRWLMTIVLYIARWLGSVWHPVKCYDGACAPVWTALAEQHVLDTIEHDGTEKGKWGSSTNIWGEVRVRRTEVGGWGWRGRVEEIGVEERRGRKDGAVDLTAEAREEFEVLGGRCWREMERLRGAWEEKVKVGIGKEQGKGGR
jgi:3-keto steroid reductase